MIFSDLTISIQIAIFAFVFRCVLMQPFHLFNWYFVWLDKLVGKRMEWIAFPLGYCAKCFAGNLAWIAYLHVHWHETNPVLLVSFVTITIFITYFFEQINGFLSHGEN